ncbi:MAG: hypothetical protein L3J87_03895 [Thermoplasmata archaeon]|nr:hypothetical protein [Thermoplasmata archaeon]
MRVTDVVRKAQQLGTSLRRIAADLPEKGRALVVTHGGVPELCAVALRPEDDAGAWGEPCRCLEGVRITFVGEVPEQVVILRVDPRRTRL